MKKLLILSLLIFVSLMVQAQDFASQSKIKLADGSELLVLIIENIPGKYIKIKLPGNEETIIDYRNIKSIKHKSFVYHSKFKLAKGFNLDGSFSLLFGNSSELSSLRTGLALAITGNYRFNSYLSIGLGIEPSALLINGGNLILPVYAHFKGNFIERRIAPIYFLDAGWSFVASNASNTSSTDGGWFLRPGVGLQFNNFTLGLGYQLQKITTTTENSWWWGGGDQTVVEERLMRNITISATINF